MSAKKKVVPLDMGARLRLIEITYNEVTPEDEKKALRVLEKNNAMDLVGLLGLPVPQVTNPESGTDTNVPVQVVPGPV